jgi:hypothetical protein
LEKIERCGYTNYIIQDMGGYKPAFVEKQFNLFMKKTGGLSGTRTQNFASYEEGIFSPV